MPLWSLSGRRTGKKSSGDKIKANLFFERSYLVTRAGTPAPSSVHVVILSHCHMVSLWTVSRNICLFVAFTMHNAFPLSCITEMRNKEMSHSILYTKPFSYRNKCNASLSTSPLSVLVSVLGVVVQTEGYCCWLSVEFQLWSSSWSCHWLWSGKSAGKMVIPRLISKQILSDVNKNRYTRGLSCLIAKKNKSFVVYILHLVSLKKRVKADVSGLCSFF